MTIWRASQSREGEYNVLDTNNCTLTYRFFDFIWSSCLLKKLELKPSAIFRLFGVHFGLKVNGFCSHRLAANRDLPLELRSVGADFSSVTVSLVVRCIRFNISTAGSLVVLSFFVSLLMHFSGSVCLFKLKSNSALSLFSDVLPIYMHAHARSLDCVANLVDRLPWMISYTLSENINNSNNWILIKANINTV